MEKLDSLVAEHLERQLLQSDRLEKSWHQRSIAARNGRNAGQRISPNYARAWPKRTPSLSGSLTPSRKAWPTLPTRCSRTGLPSSRPSAIRSALTRTGPGRDRTVRPDDEAAGAQHLRERGPQAHPYRKRRLSSTISAPSLNASRLTRTKLALDGLQERTDAHARRRVKRKNGGFRRSQFGTEMARQYFQ